MKLDLIIKNGTIVTDKDIFKSNIGIQGEKVAAIADNLSSDTAEIIDASDKYIFPGGIDPHTHLDMPLRDNITSKDDFETGTIAAAYGGTTTIIDFCTQEKGHSLSDALDIWHNKAKDKAVIDYGFHLALTDINDDILKEIKDKIKAGYPSYKLYTTYDALRLNDDDFLKVFSVTKEGGIVCVHCEDNEIVTQLTNQFKKEGKLETKYHPLSRPPAAEGKAVHHVVQLANSQQAPLYIVHLTCKDALQEVTKARAAHQLVMAETCTQYLLLSDKNYSKPTLESIKYVISPPLRTTENQTCLWEGLAENKLQLVSTDHCPFDFKGQKDLGINNFTQVPGGIAGLETRMALIFDRGVNAGRISLNRFVEITSTNAAKIFGMYPEKGNIAIGADADLVVFDPKLQKTITHDSLHENVDYTVYEGFQVMGYPVITINRGAVIVKEGKFLGKAGRGKFLKRKTPQII